MVSIAAILSVATAVAITVDHVQAHGYVEIPESEFVDSATSEYIVQIEPQWDGDWEGADGDDGLVALYQELKASNNVDDIRTLLDSDTSLYGADCGYTDPDADPKDPPTDGTATFSRGMVHAGPCEIWLDDTLVLTNDNCQDAYGDGTQDTASVFTPVDYSSCSSSGCMFRFYWLALQRLDGDTVWQVYKDCIPLSGPAGSSTSTSSTATSMSMSTTSSVTGESSESSTTEFSAAEATSEASETYESSKDDNDSELSKDDEDSDKSKDDEDSEESKGDNDSEKSNDEEDSEDSKDDSEDSDKSKDEEEAEDYSDEIGGEAGATVTGSPSVTPASASKCARRSRN